MSNIELSLFGTATLGAVIAGLERIHPDAAVQFDFCYLAPAEVDSYRGYYEHLALGWKDRDAPPYWPQASELLATLKAAQGATFEGWKGGQYRMRADTPLWVANRGNSGGTGIVGLDLDGDRTAVIRTAKVD